MKFIDKRYRPLVTVLAVMLVINLTMLYKARHLPPSPHPPQKPETSAHSILASPPDWNSLEIYQETITRGDFAQLLTSVFTTGEKWKQTIVIDENEARIRTGNGDETFHLHFAPPDHEKSAPRQWRTAAELPPTTAEKPLAGLKIAIDPGHIGGDWAKMEERWMVVGDGTPVCEGDMTLLVATLLKPKLEALGAAVSLVREKPEPLTKIRPKDLESAARESSPPTSSAGEIQKAAERLFYRSAEIHTRAERVNQRLKPDLVLCLHFNAEPWGNPNDPTLIDHSHFHLLLNGAYTDDEVALADQRHALLQKLLQRSHQEEVSIGTTVADTFSARTGLPPFVYPPESSTARPVNGNPHLWARNLLANRLYGCPVIFMEPYVMNSTIDYPRFQAGDYEGLREIGGKSQPSIFREYADAVAEGLQNHYTHSRRIEPSVPKPPDR